MSSNRRPKSPTPPPFSELSLLVQTLLSEPKSRRLRSVNRQSEPRSSQRNDSRSQRERVAQLFEKWGYGSVKDEAEQLRLALMLLECHDEAVSSRPDDLTSQRD